MQVKLKVEAYMDAIAQLDCSKMLASAYLPLSFEVCGFETVLAV